METNKIVTRNIVRMEIYCYFTILNYFIVLFNCYYYNHRKIYTILIPVGENWKMSKTLIPFEWSYECKLWKIFSKRNLIFIIYFFFGEKFSSPSSIKHSSRITGSGGLFHQEIRYKLNPLGEENVTDNGSITVYHFLVHWSELDWWNFRYIIILY